MTTQSWPTWFSQGDCAMADLAVKGFIKVATEHRASCPICQNKQPCDELHTLIDDVESKVKEIGEVAFPRYVTVTESKYSHRDYWTDK